MILNWQCPFQKRFKLSIKYLDVKEKCDGCLVVFAAEIEHYTISRSIPKKKDPITIQSDSITNENFNT